MRIGGKYYFAPESSVNRRDMAAFIYRAEGSPAYDAPTSAPFWDVPVGSQFAKEIAWLKAEGITHGNPGGSYAPGSSIHRAAMAAFLYRIYAE